MRETVESFLLYHAIEGGLLNEAYVECLLKDAMSDGLLPDTEGLDYCKLAIDSNTEAQRQIESGLVPIEESTQ